MKSIRLLSIIILTILMIVPSTSANFSVTTDIQDAYYLDSDLDGASDDIAVHVHLTVSNIWVYTDVDIYIGIELPSGFEFWFTTSFTVEKYTYDASFMLNFDLVNTATESGWYWAHVVAFAEGESYSIMSSLMFDPPGGKENDPPFGSVQIIAL